MPVKPIPDGYHTVTPYLLVEDVEKLLEFLKQAFGAKETERIPSPDGTVTHAEVRIGDSVIMMGKPRGEFRPLPSMIYLYTENVDAVYKRALQAGATSVMEPADQFYGDRNGGAKDPLGNLWWIATHQEDVSHEELIRRAHDMAERH